MNYINVSADAQYTIRPDSRAGREEGMELTLKGIQDKKAWEAAGIALPSYDVEAVAAASRKNPMWVHFGIGNIFRIFLGGICDRLLNEGLTDRGITCAETFDYDLVDMIYDPYDNLGLSVILNNDGTREIRVLGSMTEAVRADASRPECWARLKENFLSKDLVKQMLEDHYSQFDDFNVDDYLASYDEDKAIDGNTYGMSKLAVERLKVIESIDGSKEIDWDKFNSGDYVLAIRFDYNHDNQEYLNFFNPGEKVKIRSHDPKYRETIEVEAPTGDIYPRETYENAPMKEYEVYAVVDIPYAMGLQMYSTFNCDLILPEDEFLSLYGDWKPMRTIVDVEDDKEEAFEDWLKNYTTSVDSSLSYKSKDSIVAQYKSFGDMMALVGSVVSAILGLIGLLNFANTIITSILVRSRELAMLEAVGMTIKQQKKSLRNVILKLSV